MKIIFSILSTLLLSLTANAAHHEEASEMQAPQFGAGQIGMCSLKPGKTMAEYHKMSEDYIRWSQKNGAEVLYMRAVPLFASPRANTQSFDFIDMMGSTFEQSGDAWKKWLSTKEGLRLNEKWQSLANCRTSINAFTMPYVNRDALNKTDERVITFDWCTRREGVSWDDLNAVHQQVAADGPADSSVLGWAIMFPGVGIDNPPGEFAHILTYADTTGLMSNLDRLANKEGWRQREEYETKYASCTGQNAYLQTVYHRPNN